MPPAPIPLTPGPLATRLRSVYSNALSHTIRTCSYENFSSCFPTPAAKTPRVLRAVWEQIVGKIESKAGEEFEGILAERDVVKGLNELEALLGSAKARRETSEGDEGEIVP